MKIDDNKPLEIDILMQLDGMGTSAKVFMSLAQRQTSRQMVEEAMAAAQTHGFEGARIVYDGRLYLTVYRKDPNGGEDVVVSLTDENSREGQSELLIDAMYGWRSRYGNALDTFETDRWQAIIGKDMALSQRDHWVKMAVGEDILAGVAAKKRATRSLMADRPETRAQQRSRSRP